MTSTSDDDGTTPFDLGDAFPVTPAYGSRALGDRDVEDTAPLVGFPFLPVPVDVVEPETAPPPAPEPVAAPAPPPAPEPVAPPLVAPAAMVAPEVVAPQVSADEHPTVVLGGDAAGATYGSDDVLPAGPVGRAPRTPRSATESSASDGGGPGEPRVRRTGRSPLGRVVLPLILALLSGVAIVAGWVHLQEDRAAASVAPSTGPTRPSASAASTPSPSPTASASPTVSTPPVASPSTSTSTSASSTATPGVDRSVPVVVLNSTDRKGLAAKVAAQLRTAGWTVVTVGNFRGPVAITTVYAEGNADAVATLQDDLPTKDRLRSPVGAMNPERLTVVVGTDYPRT